MHGFVPASWVALLRLVPSKRVVAIRGGAVGS